MALIPLRFGQSVGLGPVAGVPKVGFFCRSGRRSLKMLGGLQRGGQLLPQQRQQVGVDFEMPEG